MSRKSIIIISVIAVVLIGIGIYSNLPECSICGSKSNVSERYGHDYCDDCYKSAINKSDYSSNTYSSNTYNNNYSYNSNETDTDVICDTSYSSLSKNQKLTIIRWIESRYDYYDKVAGGYAGDKYTDTIFNEAASRYNKTYQEIDDIWFQAYDLKYK